MLWSFTLADACDPSLPGCQPEDNTPLLFVALVMLFAVLLVVAGVVVLIVFLVRRGRRTTGQAAVGQAASPMVAPGPAQAQASGIGVGAQTLPGWQPDPTGRFEWRWWDGQNWTDSVTDGGPSQTDPAG